MVSYKETVTQKSSIVCMAKSQNKHNRVYAVAEPLDEQFNAAIENKEFAIHGD